MRLSSPHLSTGLLWLGLLAGSAGLFASSALGQTAMEEQTHMPLHRDSGWVMNSSNQREVIASFTVDVPGASWMRLYFGPETTLGGDVFQGSGAYLVLTSHADGAVQVLNGIALEQWQKSSAYFNGDAVQVDLVAHPGSDRHRVNIDTVDLAWGVFQSQCGANDDRLPDTDPRSGRLLPIGCTGWLIDDCAGCSLTAGHCTGNISVLQFNVPPSTSGGGLQQPPPEDQYAVDASSIQSNGGQGVGNDWAYFGTFPNSNTGLTAAEAQGTYVLGVAPSPTGNNIRITGYGADSTPPSRNQTLQTHLGPMAVNSGTQLGYTTDTEGGNSGSPVIWEETGLAVGIHTHGGCSSNGYNSGTNLQHPALQAALANPQGICSGGSLNVIGGVPEIVPPNVPVDVEVNVVGAFTPGSVMVHWRSGGAFQAITMNQVSGGLHGAQIPGPACGNDLEFYFSVDSNTCGLLFEPSQGASAPFSVGVGVATELFADNFQSDQGWSTENLGASSGDWQRGTPVNDNGWAYDPASDGDGSGLCYLTQNQTGNTDVDGGSVRLTSPAFDLTATSSIEFLYYLYLTQSNTSDSLLIEVSSNGLTGPWSVLDDINVSGDLDWQEAIYAPSAWMAAGISPSSNARIRFTADDADPQSIVEAGIDGFRVVEVACGGTGDLTDTFCGPAVQHSGGVSATIRGFGSTLIADNDVTLFAENLPTGQFGYFLIGSEIGFVPNVMGSQGVLCLGGALGRYNGTFEIFQSGAAGEGQLTLDLNALPFNPAVPAVSGESYHFQCWFRDQNPGSTSNFTDGLRITVF